MNRRYESLRLESLRNAAIPAAVGAAFLLDAEPAAAETITLTSSSYSTAIQGGGAVWYVANSTSATKPVSGMGIDGAHLTTGSAGSVLEGSFVMTVNGTAFRAPDGMMDLSGNTISATSPVGAYSGLTVTAQFYFDTNSPTVRALYTYTNPTNSPITVTVQWQNFLEEAYIPGIVSAHTAPVRSHDIVSTSTGDTTESAGDHWVIVQDTGNSYIDMVRYGPGASATPSIVKAPSSTINQLFDQYSVTVPANQSRALMFFARLSSTKTAALNGAATFNSTGSLASAGLLAGLTTQQEAQILNWSFAPASGIPALSTLTFCMLGGLMAALGARFLRRPLINR